MRVKSYLLCLTLLRVYSHMTEASDESAWMEELRETLINNYPKLDENLLRYFSCELYMTRPSAMRQKTMSYDPEKKVFLIREKDDEGFTLTTLSSAEDPGLPVKREQIYIRKKGLLRSKFASRELVFATAEHIEMIKLRSGLMMLEEQPLEDMIIEARKGQLVHIVYRERFNLAVIKEIFKEEGEACVREWLADPDNPADLIRKEPLLEETVQEQTQSFWRTAKIKDAEKYSFVTKEFLQRAKEASGMPEAETAEEASIEEEFGKIEAEEASIEEEFGKIEAEVQEFLDYMQEEASDT